MKTVANKWDQRGNILSLSVPVAPTIILIGEVLYELDTTQSMHFFPPVYIWSNHTPVFDLAIRKWFDEHACNAAVVSPLYVT